MINIMLVHDAIHINEQIQLTNEYLVIREPSTALMLPSCI